MTIYLYKKTHNITGLKYLGKTKNDPYKYKGSGKYWGHHIKLHGYDVTTEILRECQTNKEVKEWGIYYSLLWNIVESDDWANLKLEEGDGGFCELSITPEANQKRSNSLKNRIFTEEHRKRLSEANKGKYWLTEESVRTASAKASAKLKGRKKPEGFGEKVGNRLRGTKMSDEAKTKMKSAWTPERRAAQSERARLMNLARKSTDL